MANSGMAKHSESSFNESDSIGLLSKMLESEHNIKTFFKENDRTPNYDGTFEIVKEEGEPTKQFVVQIKKVGNLQKAVSGKNAGKYVYDMETAFLYYVKEKVTESPAVYFVVDIHNRRIFYTYLSDEKLMLLDFEGKAHVHYAFSNNEILTDVKTFYKKMNVIAKERNQKYLYRSPEEIAKMQDAADYINTLLTTDFKVIKKFMFPNLWRFGVGFSKTAEFEIHHYSRSQEKEMIFKPEKTNMFGLYPQYKGKMDQEISEFREESLFQEFDCSGTKSPMHYAQDQVNKIIKEFCSNPPISLLPTIVLHEIIYSDVMNIADYFPDESEIMTVSKSNANFIALLRFIDHIIFEQNLTENEMQFKSIIIRNNKMANNSLDLLNPLLWGNVKSELAKFYDVHYKEESFKLHTDLLFRMLNRECLQHYSILGELAKRGAEHVEEAWKYKIRDIYNGDIFLVQNICKKWFSELPTLYAEFYENVFLSNTRHKFSVNAEYYLFSNDHEANHLPKILGRCKVYNPDKGNIRISYAEIKSDDYSVDCKENCLKHISSGDLFMPFLQNRKRTLYYDGLRCFLYQGICDSMEMKCDGIYLNGRRQYLFS